jgi:pyruvate formate lyase activating enzyme
MDERVKARKDWGCELQGLVFNIVRGSFVDGHGVRTTVFLKGCPLRCDWCCNVEGQKAGVELKVTRADCSGCGRCVPVCPVGAIELGCAGDGGTLRVDRGLCTDCGKCVLVCYTGALDCFGKYYTVSELAKLLGRDEAYYRASGGGVTIGGGEPTLQPEFTLALIENLQGDSIHVALDTCGYTTSELGFRCLAEADLLLYDLKHMDSGRHLALTGVPNEPILENLRNLDKLGRHIIVRIPVIPGGNDSEENLHAAARFLSGLKSLERLDLIGYHNYSMMKYEQLGLPYLLEMPPAGETYMQKIKALFDGYGIAAQIGG